MKEKSVNLGQSQGDFPSHTKIAERAHELWEKYGQPADRDVAIWLEAESELAAPPTATHPSADRQASANNPVFRREAGTPAATSLAGSARR